MRVLVLGASGLLGNATLRTFVADAGFDAWGTVRSATAPPELGAALAARIETGLDVLDDAALAATFERRRPELVINCVGITDHAARAGTAPDMVRLNAELPHRLAELCREAGGRLIQVSTDCVFSGRRGGYAETDAPDPVDHYGRTKLQGEVDRPHAVTLRTSFIGHELASARGLLGWFLAQEGRCLGYARAVFSGLPTVVLARVMRDVVARHPELHGLYHVASEPIAKLRLLQLVAEVYGKRIEIEPDASVVVDRSLDGSRFRQATGWVAPPWPELIRTMHSSR